MSGTLILCAAVGFAGVAIGFLVQYSLVSRRMEILEYGLRNVVDLIESSEGVAGLAGLQRKYVTPWEDLLDGGDLLEGFNEAVQEELT